jgi:septal ring factor EnvC (AmiA/AmiB activator)
MVGLLSVFLAYRIDQTEAELESTKAQLSTTQTDLTNTQTQLTESRATTVKWQAQSEAWRTCGLSVVESLQTLIANGAVMALTEVGEATAICDAARTSQDALGGNYAG